jgi:DNA sulfur modification protein DndD
MGIEGLLGAAILRELSDDLSKYAQKVRQSTLDIDQKQVEESRVEAERLEAEALSVRERLHEVTDQYDSAVRRRDELTSQFAGGKQGEMATLADLHSKQTRLEIVVAQQREQLASFLMTDFALALSGTALRDRATAHIAAELELGKWEGAVKSTRTQVGRFLAAFEAAEPALEPPLSDAQWEILRRKVEQAWQSILHPPPDGCAKTVRHDYLGEREKMRVLDHLQRLTQLGVVTVEELLTNIDANERDLKRVSRQIAEVSGVEEKLQQVADELKSLV